MDRIKLLNLLAFLVVFIFVVNFLAFKFFWYYSFWYFDIIMHFLGGLWLGLCAIYFFSFGTSFWSMFRVVFFVFTLGLAWEIYELFFNNYLAQNPFDTADFFSDIFFDLLGGLCAILYTWKKLQR